MWDTHDLLRSRRLSHNLRVKPGQKMGVLRAYLNRKSGSIFKHGSHLFVVMLVSLKRHHLPILEVHGKEVLMMRHEAHNRSHSKRKNAGDNAAHPMVVS